MSIGYQISITKIRTDSHDGIQHLSNTLHIFFDKKDTENINKNPLIKTAVAAIESNESRI